MLDAFGFATGEMLMGIIYLYTSALDITLKFLIAGFLLALASVGVIYMVREPKVKEEIEQPDGSEKVWLASEYREQTPYWTQVKELLYATWVEAMSKPKYIFAAVGLGVSRLMNTIF